MSLKEQKPTNIDESKFPRETRRRPSFFSNR